MQTDKTTKDLGILVTFPKSKNPENFEFHINSDDLPNANNFSKFLKSVLYDQGLHYVKTIRYSKVKLISWHVYKIPAHNPIILLKFLEILNPYWNLRVLVKKVESKSEELKISFVSFIGMVKNPTEWKLTRLILINYLV